ncbi:MAG: tRNA uracil 4-sulfurtransferase ThiI [Candidatus Acidiferrales bacterium]
MTKRVIVAHYHELWLKGGNRQFFLSKLVAAVRSTLEGLELVRVTRPADRLVIELGEGPSLDEARARLERVFGVAYYAVARPVDRGGERPMEDICRAAWEEIASERFSTFAVRAKRSDKSFPHSVTEIETIVGRYLLDRLRAAGHEVRVQLRDPELTCRIEIPPGPALVYARKIPGPGGLPANTAGRMACLLSGGFDSAVAAYKMMKRGAHLSFVHFWGGGARAGESSVHVARELVRRLVPYQFTAKLHLVPFEAIQREIVGQAPETYRVLLYRRMMLRIAERLALADRAQGIVAGDSLGQVASQTLHNMVAVGDAVRMPVFRPLAGDDKQEILAIARKIGTYEISAEPFHDCCPLFLPRTPALHALAEELDQAEARLDVPALVARGVESATRERYRYSGGRVEQIEEVRSGNAAERAEAHRASAH